MILVAGGSGRLGTMLVRRLAARGVPVRVLTRNRARTTQFASLPVDIVEGDVRSPADVQRAVEGTSVVVSAIHGFTGPRGISPATVDRDGNRHLIDAAARERAAVILVSVVGAAPDSPMELFRMKYAAEEYLRASGTPWTIVRATAFIEGWMEMVAQTANRSGRALVFGRGDNPINFVSIADVVALVDRVIDDPATRGQTIEIGGPEDFTMVQLAKASQPAGPDVAPRQVPLAVLKAMSLILRPFWPAGARQATAALAMETLKLRFDPSTLRARYPDLTLTRCSEVMARRAAGG